MDVILLERVAKLGQMGEIVHVKNGFARNFLLPQGKALRATEANKKQFESQKIHLEARNLERKQEADVVAEKLNGQSFIVVRQAGETGQLYGSVSSRDISDLVSEAGFSIVRNQVVLEHPIKTIGLHDIAIALHPEVEATITINVARRRGRPPGARRGPDRPRYVRAGAARGRGGARRRPRRGRRGSLRQPETQRTPYFFEGARGTGRAPLSAFKTPLSKPASSRLKSWQNRG
jgi:large subunit ribosomal protein L9